MPAKKYADSGRLSQRWPDALLDAIVKAAESRGWTATQWLQEAAKGEIKRQWRREADESR